MQLRCPLCNVPAVTGIPPSSTVEDLEAIGGTLYKILCVTMERLGNPS